MQPATFTMDDVDATLCTHLIYAFFRVTASGQVQPYNVGDEVDVQTLVSNAHRDQPGIKVLLAIGGANEGSNGFRTVIDAPASRASFIASCITTARTLGLDGIDLDWEFPNQADKPGYTKLVQEMSTIMEIEASFSGQPRLLLSAALSVNAAIYDVPAIARHLDIMNLMTYDLFGVWNPQLGLHSGLYPRMSDPDPTLNQHYAVSAYLAAGAPAEKLVLGVPLHGKSLLLQSSSAHQPGDFHGGIGSQGYFTQTPGFLAYYEVCMMIRWGIFTPVYHNIQQANYAYSTIDWVSYDSVRSVQDKVNYIKQRGLRGIMIWDLSLDDHRNFCGEGTNPVLSMIKAALRN